MANTAPFKIWLFLKVVDKSSLLKVLSVAEDRLGIPRAILRSDAKYTLIYLQHKVIGRYEMEEKMLIGSHKGEGLGYGFLMYT